jgi:hypothetical protein
MLGKDESFPFKILNRDWDVEVVKPEWTLGSQEALTQRIRCRIGGWGMVHPRLSS